MEYKDTDLTFIYDLTEGLNLLGKKLNLQGRFIPAVKITATESSFKCFKNMSFSLFYCYKSHKVKLVAVDFVGKTMEGSLLDSIKVWKRLITSNVLEWASSGGIKDIQEENFSKYGTE